MSAVSALTTNGKDGSFKRSQSKHRSFIVNDKDKEHLKKKLKLDPDCNVNVYPVEADRYHLHIALACPWAAGVLTMLKLKGLDHVISHSIVHPTWGKTKPDKTYEEDKHNGWIFKNPGDAAIPNPLGHGLFPCDDALIPDTVTNCDSVRDIYELCGDTVGPFTTPVLYDKKSKTIVNNESTEILRMLNDNFNDLAKHPEVNLYPEEEEEGERLMQLNDSLVYPKVNNGVYKCGFAKSQGAYNEAVEDLFGALEELEDMLGKTRYLGGDKFTWLDLRLFMTLVRFDPVYITYFKTNKKRLVDYPNLLGYVRDIYSIDAVKDVTNMDHIKTHYFTSHPVHNTFGIIPVYNGPDLNEPHGRDKM